MAAPTIVIVPGACQTPEFYEDLAHSLQHQGFATEVVSTPSVGASPGLLTFAEDVEAVRKTIVRLADQDRDVILLMHSYGGIPASAASQGLGKAERTKAGKAGGIIRLLYVASFALRIGETMPGSGDYDTLETYAVLDEKVSTHIHTLVSIHVELLLTQLNFARKAPCPSAKKPPCIPCSTSSRLPRLTIGSPC